MADFVIPMGDNVTLLLDWTLAGLPDTNVPPGGTITTSDPTVATATVGADDKEINIRSVSLGIGITISYVNTNVTPNLTATLVIDVVTPSPDAVMIDTKNPIFAPNT